jgi:hypothetical protein
MDASGNNLLVDATVSRTRGEDAPQKIVADISFIGGVFWSDKQQRIAPRVLQNSVFRRKPVLNDAILKLNPCPVCSSPGANGSC